MKRIKNLITTFESDYKNYIKEQDHKLRAEIATDLSDSATVIAHMAYDYVNDYYDLRDFSIENRAKMYCNMMHALKCSQEYYGFNSTIDFIKNVIEIFEKKENK
jgi:ABC-type Zn2+ transport system substrate-binding protein/surface adhesin